MNPELAVKLVIQILRAKGLMTEEEWDQIKNLRVDDIEGLRKVFGILEV